MFFGICSASGVQLQVAPRKSAGSDADQSETPSPQRKVDLIRLKPQPSQHGSMSPSGSKLFTLTAEDELFLFVNDIRYNNVQSLATYSSSSEALGCYTFEHSNFAPSSGLVVILKNCVSKHIITSTTASPTLKAITTLTPKASFVHQTFDNTLSLSAACKTLNLLLGSYLSNPDKGQSHQGGAGVKLKSIGAGLNSIENILIITVNV